MDSRILLFKMTAKGFVLTHELGGGKIFISAEDVSTALGMKVNNKPLHRRAYVTGLVKYCDDTALIPELRAYVQSKLAAAAKREVNKGLVDVVMQEGLTVYCAGIVKAVAVSDARKVSHVYPIDSVDVWQVLPVQLISVSGEIQSTKYSPRCRSGRVIVCVICIYSSVVMSVCRLQFESTFTFKC